MLEQSRPSKKALTLHLYHKAFSREESRTMASITLLDHVVDLEQEAHPVGNSPLPAHDPHLQHSIALQAAVEDVAECRAKLKALGEPPDHETVEQAEQAITAINATLSSELERLVLEATPEGMDRANWPAIQAQKENELREAARVAKLPYEEILQIEEFHRSFESLLKAAEEDMIKLSSSSDLDISDGQSQAPRVEESINEDVVLILQAAQQASLKEVDLKGRGLTYLPDAFGKISTIVTLDLSSNKLEVLSDSIGGLTNLQSLNLENNDLGALPDSIGLLTNLKILNLSENKLTALPESILKCSCLVSLKANLNQLTYLPSQIGFSLLSLQHLAVQWNKLRLLPSSLCNLKSLKCLEVRFNHLKSLPAAIGNLTNLEIIDASCNFSDLEALPATIGDLVSLIDLNISCNQIQTLPDSFGRLQNLKKINLKDNPLVIPPMEIAEGGVEAVMTYMKDRWHHHLEEEQRQAAEGSPQQTKWVPWGLGGSWLTRVFSGISDQGRWQGHGSEEYMEQML